MAGDPARAKQGCPNESATWPEYGAGWLPARLFFTWWAPMERLGAATPLEHTDLWTLHERESTRKSFDDFEEKWQAELQRVAGTDESPSLSRVILKSCLRTVIEGALLRLTTMLSRLARPLVMQQILMVAEGDESAIVSESFAYILAFGMFGCAVGEFLCYAHYMHVVNKAGWRVREALIGMLFRKVTWLSPGTKATYSSGKITNMMSSDCDRLRFVVTQLNLLWIIPLQFFCALGLVINMLGPAGLMGLALLMVLAPTQRWIMRQLQNNRRAGLKQTDERLKLVQEVMSGIRTQHAFLLYLRAAGCSSILCSCVWAAALSPTRPCCRQGSSSSCRGRTASSSGSGRCGRRSWRCSGARRSSCPSSRP